ncbi:uncharacterized protein LOC115598530 [Calypte anna]|uniref:uncharacterized protein LOC115598530 n=1 Tax=Calypte anna TaxID=9244 RepID=UPI0011C4091D|nr:uncharacterized protein LOC115598530 [Calypte anna]
MAPTPPKFASAARRRKKIGGIRRGARRRGEPRRGPRSLSQPSLAKLPGRDRVSQGSAVAELALSPGGWAQPAAVLPRNFALDLRRSKTLLDGEKDTDSHRTTPGCDSRAALAPPRPVISLPLPTRVNNSPGCQMQVTFVAAMKEPERRGLIFGGQEEVWGIN